VRALRRLRGLLARAGRGGAQPVAVVSGLNDVGVEREPVDDGGDEAKLGMIEPHSLNGRLLATATDAYSSRSVRICRLLRRAR
jgi:hypothetical protein